MFTRLAMFRSFVVYVYLCLIVFAYVNTTLFTPVYV